MHSVLGAARIGEGASHMLEPDVGCETGEGGHGKKQSIRVTNAWQKEQAPRLVRKDGERL